MYRNDAICDELSDIHITLVFVSSPHFVRLYTSQPAADLHDDKQAYGAVERSNNCSISFIDQTNKMSVSFTLFGLFIRVFTATIFDWYNILEMTAGRLPAVCCSDRFSSCNFWHFVFSSSFCVRR